MATQTLPQVVPIRKPAEITQAELGLGYAKRVLAATKPETYVSLVVTADGGR